MQDNAARQWWYNTILAVSIILNTGRFAKMVYPNFFNEDGVGILIILTQKLNDCREKSLTEILATKMTNIHSIPSAYNHYFHRLLTAPANASPPKHCFANSNRENAESLPPAGLEWGLQQWNSEILTKLYATVLLLVFINLPLITPSLMNPLVQTCSHSHRNYGLWVWPSGNIWVGLLVGNSPWK